MDYLNTKISLVIILLAEGNRNNWNIDSFEPPEYIQHFQTYYIFETRLYYIQTLYTLMQITFYIFYLVVNTIYGKSGQCHLLNRECLLDNDRH